VLSTPSIEACILEVRALTNGTLDILVNNAGAGYLGALIDTSLSDARALFDLNVWSGLAMIQAFLPLLLRSKRPGGAVIVNHTSVSSVMAPPFVALYGASKAAMAMLTVSLRAELRPFGVRVIDLKSGSTRSNIGVNANRASGTTGVPEKSLYYAARGWLNELYTGAPFDDQAIASDVWAKTVVASLEKKEPPNTIWVGAFAWTVWFASNFLPSSVAEKLARDASGVDKVERSINEYGTEKAIEDAYGKK
jgi:NAD(P)-dependent dehydrogenase (short-subunit alcohol dehydrogenase family)